MTDRPFMTKDLLAALDCIRDAIPGQPLTLTAGQVFQIMMLLPPAVGREKVNPTPPQSRNTPQEDLYWVLKQVLKERQAWMAERRGGTK